MGTARDRGVETPGKPDVFVTYVDADEAAQISGVIDNPAAKARIGRLQIGDDLSQRPRLHTYPRRAGGVSAKNGRYTDRNIHSGLPFLPRAERRR